MVQTKKLPAQRTESRLMEVKQKEAALAIYKPLNEIQLQQLQENLDTEELKVILSERNGQKLKYLTEDELHDTVVDIVSEVKLITGAMVYEGAELRVQVETIKRFLFSAFHMLTKEEVLNAFYLNSSGQYGEVYRHYNKELNTEFMGDVLRAYLRHKVYIREIKGPLINQVLMIGPKDTVKRDIDYEFWKEMIQQEYYAYCHNQSTMQIWNARKYYTLRKFGLLPLPKGFDTWLFMAKKVLNGSSGTKLPPGADIKNYQFASYSDVYRLFHTVDDQKKFIDYLRRYTYWYILKACRDCGINHLWNEIAPCYVVYRKA